MSKIKYHLKLRFKLKNSSEDIFKALQAESEKYKKEEFEGFDFRTYYVKQKSDNVFELNYSPFKSDSNSWFKYYLTLNSNEAETSIKLRIMTHLFYFGSILIIALVIFNDNGNMNIQTLSAYVKLIIIIAGIFFLIIYSQLIKLNGFVLDAFDELDKKN